MTSRVLVVDDHPLYREGLVTAISTMPGKEVVGEAANGEEAIRLAKTLVPDVVVMDLHMPVMNGVEATRRLTEEVPAAAVLVLTMLETDESVFAAVRAGAKGYLLKGADRSEIARALDVVAHGEVVFSAGIAARVLSYFASGRPGPEVRPFPELTDREREVLDLVARSFDNATISQRLVLSPKTVRNHVANVLAKLSLKDRAAAIVAAREAGLGG